MPGLLAKPLAILTRVDERLDHFRLHEVSVELVELLQPEAETGFVRIAAEITEVFHHHERFVELRPNEAAVFCYLAQHGCSRHRAVA